MKVTILTASRRSVTVDADYNETVENVLVKCSLVVTDIRFDNLHLAFNGQRLMRGQRLNEVGYAEGQALELREGETQRCCGLL